MGMNPDTNQFEPLTEATEYQRELLGRMTADVRPGVLLRPNGEPVPAHWPVLREGEELVVKHYTFRVAHIGEKHLPLEPVGIPQIGVAEKHRKILEGNPKRKRRG